MKILGCLIIGLCLLATLQILAALLISARANRRAEKRFQASKFTAAARLGSPDGTLTRLQSGPTFPVSPERRKPRIGHLFHLNSHLFS